MSSLIFYCDEQEALVAMDTLIASPEAKPIGYTNKAIYLQDFNTIVAVTGVASIFPAWLKTLGILAKSMPIETMNQVAVNALPEIERGLREAGEWIEGKTATIYHFGIGADGRTQLHAFRSEKGYANERLAYGLGVKPPLSKMPDDLDKPFGELAVELMNLQREEQSMIPPKERVCIGGEVFLLRLTGQGIEGQMLHQFPEFTG